MEEVKNTNKQRDIAITFLVGLLGGVIGSLFVFRYYQVNQQNLSLGNNSRLEEFSRTVQVVEESSAIEVAQNAQASVVSILAFKEESIYDTRSLDLFEEFFDYPSSSLPDRNEKVKRQVSGGSGFVIESDGLILTNRHVVEDESAQYQVVMADGVQYDAKVLARDTINDLAFVKIEAKDLPALKLGDSKSIKIGETVIAIGNTLSEYSNTVTKGIVSGIDRKVKAGGVYGDSEVLESAIQTDAAINPGNSGGPLLNLGGQVIGINTAVDRGGEGIGFAIPINEAKGLIDDVKKFGRIVRPFLGVRYVLINEKIAQREGFDIDHGALVIGENGDGGVVKGSPADLAGVKAEDIIYKINGKDVTVEDTLAELLAAFRPEDEIVLTIKRQKIDLEIKVKLVDREEFNK